MGDLRAALTAVILLCGAVQSASADVRSYSGTISGVVVDGAGRPLPGVTVVLSTAAPSPAVVVTRSDPRGQFAFLRLPPGTYSVLALFGDVRDVTRGLSIGPDSTARLRITMPFDPEVITIRESPPPVTLARPTGSGLRKRLPYSSTAIDRNAWAVGWMLLDIDARGQVTGFRFLHKPGNDLEQIAKNEIWKLRFDPARDAHGRPVPSQLLWKMEWPSYWWLQTKTMDPTASFVPSRHSGPLGSRSRGNRISAAATGAVLPPCRGTAPLNLDSVTPIYRDCSAPDLDASSAPLVTRPAGK